jgi:hypothetical protein
MTDWVSDPKVQYQFGWYFVYSLGPLFMANIGYVVLLAVDICQNKCKKKRLQKLA